MNVLDLFSGIGGFSLGLERAGMRTVAFCEIDPYCRAVLRKHWPHVPCLTDVRQLQARDISEPIDVICGGFPCQPFSFAGKRLGSEDNRHLWPEYLRLIEELRPSWVIGENVVGLINLGLDNVLTDLESIGYAARTFDIPACGVGAHHERRRIWIVAHPVDGARTRLGQHGGTVLPREASIRSSGSGSPLADSGSNGRQGGGKAGIGEQASKGNDIREATAGRVGRAGPGRRAWEPEPNVGRVADGVPRRVDRLRALGNAVVPQIPEIIGRAIMKATA